MAMQLDKSVNEIMERKRPQRYQKENNESGESSESEEEENEVKVMDGSYKDALDKIREVVKKVDNLNEDISQDNDWKNKFKEEDFSGSFILDKNEDIFQDN